MSATATTTLSDTLVVGRQPQQPVGFRSVLSFFSHHFILPASPVLPRLLPPPATRESNGLDPQFTSANRPGGVRFSPRARVNKHTHHHPTQATTTRPASVRPACCGVFRTDVVLRGCASHAEGMIGWPNRRAKGQFACGQRRGKGEDYSPEK